jgi:hypothetical protein
MPPRCGRLRSHPRRFRRISTVEDAEYVDYTGADCCGWMVKAGFRETRVEHLVGPDSMAIGVK